MYTADVSVAYVAHVNSDNMGNGRDRGEAGSKARARTTDILPIKKNVDQHADLWLVDHTFIVLALASSFLIVSTVVH